MRKIFAFVLALTISLGLLIGQKPAEASSVNGSIDRTEGGIVTVSSEDSPITEAKVNAFDNNYYSKWLVSSSSAWIQYQFAGNASYAINSYQISAANDYPDRDPKSWTLKASNNGTDWTLLDTQQNQDFAYRYKTQTYSFVNSVAYNYYKFEFSNHSGGILQLSEIQLFDGALSSVLHPQVTASGENGPNEGKENAVDGTSTTKWLTFQSAGWLQFDFGQAITLDGYAISAANDASERDPKSWTLKGSADGLTWTDIDSKSNENFKLRHQRNHYILQANQTAYRYYKLDLQNHSGTILQVGEVEFSYKEDKWHAIHPEIEFQNLDTAGNGYLFEQALPNPQEEIRAIINKVVQVLYNDPSEVQLRKQKVVITIENFDGVAGASGSASEGHIAISSRYLKSYYDSGQPLHEEIIGILYHELTHLYQFSDDNYGQIGYMIEGMADAVRFEVGYHDRYHPPIGGTWKDGYGTTGNFFRWIDEHKHHGFLREINASLDPFDGVAWTENAVQQITGIPVLTLWNEYQGADTIAPSTPSGLASTSQTSNSVSLSWNASTDNVGVTGYDIYQAGTKVGTSASTSFTITGLSAGTVYAFTVKAVDAAGNASLASAALSVTTNASNTATIYYKQGFTNPYIHYQVDGGAWTSAPGVAMSSSEVAGYSKITINLISAAGLSAAFNNGSGTWDNNNGQNYRFAAGTSTFVNGTITPGVPQPDSITFIVAAPANTPVTSAVYLVSSLNSWNPADANSVLTKNTNGTYSIKLNVSSGTSIQYKFTKGSWSSVEVNSNGTDIANRTLTTTGGAQTVNLTVQRWKDQ
ncbi:basic secretory protein-like protein [Paenibacillus sp. SI8]|uniref:basic secretory protein-like protein n=1 Tax=unclassified Paenibacillus TaxID=185978 RepID=UPI0034678FA5